uniref:Uncharacterized protein n=1 Tax=Anopheles funestus TaxID=62324 RepID=A0A182RYD3_ANOFN
MMLFRVFFIVCALIAFAIALPAPSLRKVIVKRPIVVKSAPVIVHRPIVVRKFSSHGGWW